MMKTNTIKEFNIKYMKLGQISKGANGTIYAVKNWKTRKYYASKEISFKNLNIRIFYEILRNWIMVQEEELVGKSTEIYIDSKRQILIIVLHLYKGSMCDYLKHQVITKKRCLNEMELKVVLRNGVLTSLSKLHSNGYIHGDIKPENIVYEYKKNRNHTNQPNVPTLSMNTAVIDFDLCTKYKSNNNDDDDEERDCNHSDHDDDAAAVAAADDDAADAVRNNKTNVYAEWRGTLGYSAPEWSPYRRIKSNITPKVDVFSLALTMLILLRGEQPFLCPTAVKMRLQKENPGMNIKQFVYETMLERGGVMISHCLKQMLISKQITNDLYDLLTSMLTFDASDRPNIEQIQNHQWM
eukprot:300776_1